MSTSNNLKVNQDNQMRDAHGPRRTSVPKDHPESSNIVQVLSQRLGNMEQQLVLLRDDLKIAIETLKRKDQEMATLQNKIALAERRQDRQESGANLNEEPYELSEADVGSKAYSKRKALEEECQTLAKKLQEMEKFFGDYGLAWVKEDALGRDPNDLWVRKTNVHYTPNFDKVFLVVEELNLGNMGPQIVREGNMAQFKTADLLNLALYADGIQLENNPFRPYDSPSVEEFFKDLEDGYFPTELKGCHPEGVIFKVKDKRGVKFADDPDKRPVLKPGQRLPLSTDRTSFSSKENALRKPSLRSSMSGAAGEKTVKDDGMAGTGKENLKKIFPSLPAADPKSTRKGSPQRRKSGISQKSTSKPSSPNNSEQVDVKPIGSVIEEPKVVDETAKGNVDSKADTVEGEKEAISTDNGRSSTGESEGKSEGERVSPDQLTEEDFGARKPKDLLKKLKDGTKKKNKPQSPPSLPAVPPQNAELSQLFRGNTPSASFIRVPKHEVHEEIREPTFEALKEPDSFGLPKPPRSSLSSVDVARPPPKGPPLKQFDNLVTPKTKQTQTSGLIPDSKAPPPTTHVTNITYNEAPITMQLTPSEMAKIKLQLAAIDNKCATGHTDPCDCPPDPAIEPSPRFADQKQDLERIGVVRIPGETEYRDKYVESAVNNANVLQFKKKSQEEGKSPSPPPVPRTPASTVLVDPDAAPIPPDPVHHEAIDPYAKWEHFTYLGHPKDQNPVVIPAQPQIVPLNQAAAKAVELNKKTSDRMIAVRMKTKSAEKEYTAHVYPGEPVKKLWSLLKLNEEEYSLTNPKMPNVPMKEGSIGNLSNNEDLTLIISQNGGNKGGDTHPAQGISVKKDVAGTMKEGSNVTNVSININIDSHSSLGDRTKVKDASRHSGIATHRQKGKKRSRESDISKNSGTTGPPRKGNSNASIKRKSSNASDKTQTMHELAAASIPRSIASLGSGRIDGSRSSVEAGVSKIEQNLRKSLKKEITPASRAESLSKHLSVSSLHKSSAKGSFRKLDVIGEEPKTPASDVKNHDVVGKNTTASTPQGDAGPKSTTKDKERSAAESTNSAEGVAVFSKDMVSQKPPEGNPHGSQDRDEPAHQAPRLSTENSGAGFRASLGGQPTKGNAGSPTLQRMSRGTTRDEFSDSSVLSDQARRVKLSREFSITTLKRKQSTVSENEDNNQVRLSREMSITTLKKKQSIASEYNNEGKLSSEQSITSKSKKKHSAAPEESTHHAKLQELPINTPNKNDSALPENVFVQGDQRASQQEALQNNEKKKGSHNEDIFGNRDHAKLSREGSIASAKKQDILPTHGKRSTSQNDEKQKVENISADPVMKNTNVEGLTPSQKKESGAPIDEKVEAESKPPTRNDGSESIHHDVNVLLTSILSQATPRGESSAKDNGDELLKRGKVVPGVEAKLPSPPTSSVVVEDDTAKGKDSQVTKQHQQEPYSKPPAIHPSDLDVSRDKAASIISTKQIATDEDKNDSERVFKREHSLVETEKPAAVKKNDVVQPTNEEVKAPKKSKSWKIKTKSKPSAETAKDEIHSEENAQGSAGSVTPIERKDQNEHSEDVEGKDGSDVSLSHDTNEIEAS